MSGTKWELDPIRLREAREMLGLELPVDVNANGRIRLSHGRYRGIKEGRHQIDIGSGLSPARASACLWHELTHARQREEAGSDLAFKERRYAEEALMHERLGRRTLYVNRLADRRAYEAMPLEAEAGENMEFAEAVPVCRASTASRSW